MKFPVHIIKLMKLIGLLIILFASALTCPDNCYDCSIQDTACSACAENYQRSILGRCVDSNTVPFCNFYGPNDICYSCKPTYTLINGQCIKNYSGCIEYDPADDSKCISCGFGTTLLNSVCVGVIHCSSNASITCPACLNGFSLKNGRCVDSTGNCKTIVSNGICSVCNLGYKLVGYSCIRSNVTTYGCDIYDASGHCQVCKIGYNQYHGNCLVPLQIFQIQQGLTQLSNIAAQTTNPGSFETTTTTTTTTITTTIPTPSTVPFGNEFNGFDSSSAIQNCALGGLDGACLTCNPGYYLQNNLCIKASVFCNTYDENGGCKTCRYSLILNNFQCNDPNCLQQQIEGCKLCQPLFSTNDYGLCTINDPNCIEAAQNRCRKCSQGYQITARGTCSLQSNTIPNCLQQTGLSCNRCISNYRLLGNICISISFPLNCQMEDLSSLGYCLTCNDGFSNINGSCVQISSSLASFCQSYSLQTGKCLACIDKYILQGSFCIKISEAGGAIIIQDGLQQNPNKTDPNCVKHNGTVCSLCSSRYYFGPNGLCIPVNPLCNNYSSKGACLSCYPGYSINGTICIAGIKLSDPNCKSFDSQGNCGSCYSSFYLSLAQKTCVPLSPLCKTHNMANGLCLSCFPGFSINAVGMCGPLYSDPYCLKFDTTLTSCIQCASKFFLDSYSKKCKQVNPLCKTANENTGECLACFEGYILQKGNCRIGGDPNCKNTTKGVCYDCYNGYFLSTSGLCVRNNQLCKTTDKAGLCLSCYRGYKLINNNCVESSSLTSNNDTNCKSVDNLGVCNSCYLGYFLNKNMFCQKSELNCVPSNTSSCPCAACYQGYTLSSCLCILSSSINSDPYCIKKQGSSCLTCSSGYYLAADGLCSMLNPLCKQSNMNNGFCTSCYQGYVLSQNNCVYIPQIEVGFCQIIQGAVCQRCINRYYIANGSCAPVSILCGDYNMLTGLCISCASQDYFLQNGQCIYPSQGKDPYCTYYENSFCTQCSPGYAVINYRCAQIDPNCIQYDQYKTTCLACSQGKNPSGPSCI